MDGITINYLAVLVAAIAQMVLGALWYGPVFGKKWMALSGLTPESVKAMKLKPWQAMLLGFISTLVMAYVLAHFAGVWGAEGVAGAFQLAFWIWLGFVATVVIGAFLWEGKSIKLFFLNAAYYLVGLSVMALIIVLWM